MGVLHRQIYKPSAFGGTSNTTLCGRVDNSKSDYNIADTDDEVTCHFCRNILDGKTKSVRLQWLDYVPTD